MLVLKLSGIDTNVFIVLFPFLAGIQPFNVSTSMRKSLIL